MDVFKRIGKLFTSLYVQKQKQQKQTVIYYNRLGHIGEQRDT